METTVKYFYMDSPLGELQLCASEETLLSMLFVETKANTIQKKSVEMNPLIKKAKEELDLFFEGKLKEFTIPLSFNGSDFQNRVWKELTRIPFGDTISYLTLAKRLGDEKCIRAAASANGKNPFAIIVPCHRVIGSNGSLTGYGGDLWRKQWLLEHEAKCCGKYQTLF
jgi:methylated-DNA-[protein]-cysteine S-methyltransferase